MKNTKMKTKKLKIILYITLFILPFQIFATEKQVETEIEKTLQIDELMVKQPTQNTDTDPNQASLKSNDIVRENPEQSQKIEPKELQKEKADMFLNFENLNLSNFVSYLGELKKINIIPNKNLDSIPVTLSTRNPLTLERSWNILLTLLDLNNFTLINVDNFYRIVPKPQGKQEPLPAYSSATGTDPEILPDTDLTIRYLYFMHNIKAETVQSFLTTMLEGEVQINKDLDVCLITDKCMNIKAAMKIITELDQGGLRQAMTILPLEHADADEVAKLFNEQITPKDKPQRTVQFLSPTQKKPSTYFSADTKIYPDVRKNSLILLGTEKNIEKLISFIKKFIDSPIQAAKSRLHIKELKYARAEALKPILTAIIKSPEGAIKTLQMGQYKFFEDVIIEADASTSTNGSDEQRSGGGNRLIIACNKDDWKRLEKIIDKLDKPQPQVAFEVMIIEVSIQEDKEFWAQLKPKNPNMIGMGVNTYFQNAYGQPPAQIGVINIIPPLKEAPGTNISLGNPNGNPGSLWSALKAISSTINFNIITQPFIVTNNHKKCSVISTDNRWIQGALDKTVGTEVARSRREKKASVSVELTPDVNLEGLVNLLVNISISNFQSESSENTADRLLKTKVSLLAGEVLVLGGLVRDRIEDESYKTPILGDIPLIGNLFRGQSKVKKQTNLYIFIRPSIIKPKFEGVDEYTQLKLDYAKYQVLSADTYLKSKDPIQRWFFKPTKQSIGEKLKDSRKGIFRPIDNYTYGMEQPKEVDIKIDPYYRSQKSIEEEQEKIKKQNAEKSSKKTRKLKSRRNNA